MNEEMNPIKHKFNIVDFIIIILVLAAVISAVLRTNLIKTLGIGQDTIDIQYTFSVEGIRDTSCEYFKDGAKFLLQSNDTDVGTLLSSEVAPAERYIEIADGSIVKTVVPERYDLTGTVKASVRKGTDGYYFNDNVFLSPGSTYYVKFDIVYFMITVLSVEEIPA